jgi:hypothetical protein
MDGVTPSLLPSEEISTFCPVRLYLANRRFDGLLDTLDAKGGSFYVLTDADFPEPGTRQRNNLELESRVELAFGAAATELRIPCRVRSMRIDDDGLFMYLGLDFMLAQDLEKRRLDDFIASLW